MSATRNLSTLADLPRGTNFVLKNGFFPLYGRHSKKGTLFAPSRQAVSEKKRPILFTEAQPFFSSLSSFRWHIYNIWVLPEIKNVEKQLTYFHPLKIRRGENSQQSPQKTMFPLKRKHDPILSTGLEQFKGKLS